MKMAKRSLSVILALIMAFGVFTVAASAADTADYSALNAAIAAKVPSTANRYFYTDQANALIDDVLNNRINWNLTTADQAVVDGYVTMVNDLNTFINMSITATLSSPLTFGYGTGFSTTPTYPYGTSGLAFYPFRAEQKAVNTLKLSASKSAVPMVSRMTGDQTFTVTLSLGSNALICAAGIPVLFDKTMLEVVGVDNAAVNVTLTPTMLGTNLANEYAYDTVLNPGYTGFWPAVYQNDTAFKAKWGAISINMSSYFDNGAPISVKPNGQENFLSIQFRVKAGAPAGNAVVYIDPNFKRDAYNKSNSLFIGRAKDANDYHYYDQLASYGAAIDVTGATVTVKIKNVVLGDVNNSGTVTQIDALMVLQYSTGMITLTDEQKLAADVVNLGSITQIDALKILKVSTGSDHF